MSLNPDEVVAVEASEPRKVKAVNAYYLAVAALLIGGLAGFTAGYFNVQPKLEAALEEKADFKERAKLAEQDAFDTNVEAEKAITRAKDKAENRLAELDKREAALETREVNVTEAEQNKASREMTAGFHTVGKTVEAGVYDTTVTSGMCYYSWKTGTGADADIVDNNIVKEGPATVTLVEGEFFENKNCGTWVRQ